MFVYFSYRRKYILRLFANGLENPFRTADPSESSPLSPSSSHFYLSIIFLPKSLECRMNNLRLIEEKKNQNKLSRICFVFFVHLNLCRLRQQTCWVMRVSIFDSE